MFLKGYENEDVFQFLKIGFIVADSADCFQLCLYYLPHAHLLGSSTLRVNRSDVLLHSCTLRVNRSDVLLGQVH